MEQSYKNLSRSRPLSPAVLADLGALKGLSPPTEAFDPEGAWEHTYRIWAVSGGPARANLGYLRIRREPDRGGRSVTLSVEKRLVLVGGQVYQTDADIKCASDALSSPRSWRIDSVIMGADGEAIKATAVKESVTVKAGKLRVKAGGRTMVRNVSVPFTSDWGLFDVAQRLSGEQTEPLEFAVLEELDMPKEGHVLRYREMSDLALNGRTLRLACYQMLGHGLLPYEYWVDDKRRLLMAISHTRAYIFDPDAPARLAAMQQQLAGRGKR